MGSKRKICFVGLYEEKNLGDPVLAYCTEWLYTRDNPDIEVSRLTLDYLQRHMKFDITYRIAAKFMRVFLHKDMPYRQFVNQFYKKNYEYFLDKLSCGERPDFLIVAGGGLVKYKCQYVGIELAGLLKAASKLNIPLIVNSVGIEGFDANNRICQLIKKNLNSKNILGVTTRDDIQTLQNHYIVSSSILTKKVADPAVWTSETFSITKQDSNTIGIGIARGDLFIDYGVDFNAENLLLFYASVIKELLARNYNVEVFTNGLGRDNDFAYRVVKKLEEDSFNISISIPTNAEEMVRTISKYKSIVATRLHSCIVAYSLNIPAVGLVWNDKLKFWGNNIGAQNNFVEIEHFNSKYIVNQMEKAIESGYDQNRREEFRNSVYSVSDYFRKKIIKEE